MSQNLTVLHVINHTHWDREWFAPYMFTERWIPRLIHNLSEVVAGNSEYQFLFDGQTMVIDDLKATDKDAYQTACQLIRDHNLAVGPYYSQNDMRMSGPESLIRNLRIGTAKVRELGGPANFTAWGVDIFGHISQSPQIHSMFGIHNVFLWRGPDKLEPFFWWKGADGTTMLAVSLFAGGYRNFYRVTVKDDLALSRLTHEVEKLQPYYPDGHIPVFDGFDLDSEPGDAASYFADKHHDWLVDNDVAVISSSPYTFAEHMRQISGDYPEQTGELISGKYASVFPGTLSARTYSKLAVDHIERLLYRYAEPLALFRDPADYPEAAFEQQNKLILQNLVHDVISGCSIDQVHEIAELRALGVRDKLREITQASLEAAARQLRDARYAYLPATGAADMLLEHQSKLYRIRGKGIGVVEVDDPVDLAPAERSVESFEWRNAHYEALLSADGHIKLDDGSFGQLVIRAENGDTYWDEPRGDVKVLSVVGPLRVERQHEGYTRVSFTAEAEGVDHKVTASVQVTFDDSALIRWQIDLSNTGTGFSVMLRQHYTQTLTKLNVGMPFDNVVRDMEDTDLLPRDIAPELLAVFNKSTQRDIDRTFTFPFQAYISPAGQKNRVHLLTKGLRAYQTERPGYIDIVLIRAVDWLMKPTHHDYHYGDAGPKYYVPDARSQRLMTVECALLVSSDGPDTKHFHQLVDQYLNPPLLFTVAQSSGSHNHVTLFDADVPITALQQYRGQRSARVYNPTPKPLQLQTAYTIVQEGIQAEPAGHIDRLSPKAIATLSLESSVKAAEPAPLVAQPAVTILNWPRYPIGPDTTQPDAESMAKLASMQSQLQGELDQLKAELEHYDGNPPNSLQHRYYVVARECMEARLSFLWNRLRARRTGVLSEEYVHALNEDMFDLVTKYNDLRIMRRMYDYIIGVDESGEATAQPQTHKTSSSHE